MDIIEILGWTYFINIEWRNIVIDNEITNYEVSNIGDIRNKTTNKILSPYTDKDGYKHVTISINGKNHHLSIHRAVAIAFIPNPENKPQVNHINGVKSINVVNNLEWATNSENTKHAFDTGLKHSIIGSNNVLSIYTDKDIKKVCQLLEKGMSNKEISKKTGVNRKYITDIKKGRRWKHISKNYNIKKEKYPEEMKESIINLLSKGYTPMKIITELNIEKCQAHISLIERLKREQKYQPQRLSYSDK